MPFHPTLSYIRPLQLNQKSKMKLTNIIQKRKHHSKFKKSVPEEDLLLAELTTNEANPRNFLGTRGTFWSKRSSDSLPFSSIIRFNFFKSFFVQPTSSTTEKIDFQSIHI